MSKLKVIELDTESGTTITVAAGKTFAGNDIIDAAQLATDSVTSDAIAANAVASSEIAANAVTASEIADDAVTTVKILDNNVTIAKIAGSSSAAADTFLKKDGTWAEAGGPATEMYSAGTAPGSPTAGYLWYDTTTNKAKVYSGTDWLTFAESFSATGGTETTYTGYKVHSFLASGNFVVAGADKSMDFMGVAGGGGGGAG